MTIADYIDNINKRYKLGNATEHTFRGDLQTLIESLVPEISATNEPKRQSCGAPDYILTKKDIPIGFIEAKDIGDKDLEGTKKIGNKEQFDRYKASLNNLIFTDYLDFHLYIDGLFITKIAIAEIQNGNIVSKITGACVSNTVAWVLGGNWLTPTSPNLIGTCNNYPFRMFTNNQERMRITQAGLVGIGTATPHAKLHLFEQENATCSAKLRLEFQTSSLPDGCGSHHSIWDLDAFDDNKFTISTPALSIPVITLTNSGNMGIGTTNPVAKLQVVGASGATIKIVDGNQANGYVLTSNAAGVASWAAPGNFSGWLLTGNNLSTSGNFMGSISGSTYPDVIFKCDGIQSGLLNDVKYNTSWGWGALHPLTTGNDNTAIGAGALDLNTSGSKNTAIGFSAGSTNYTGSENTFLGTYANAGATNLTESIAVGYNTSVGGNYSTVIGATSATIVGSSDATAIGYNVIADNYSAVIGDGSVTWVGTLGPSLWHNYSDARIKNNIKENVPGLAFIKLLKPVTFNYDIHKENNIIGYPTKKDSLGNVIGIDTAYWNGKYDVEKINYTGFIAQQVDSAAQKLGYDFSGLSKPKNANDLYSLAYAAFVVPLVKSVQELSKEQDSLKAIIANLIGTGSKINNSTGNNDSINKLYIKLTLPNTATIGDAQPNPNNGSTQIPYFLPENISEAQIIFNDMLGKVIEEKPLQPGYGLINVDTQNLPTGIYTYSLLVDGKVIDTKKMVRSK